MDMEAVRITTRVESNTANNVDHETAEEKTADNRALAAAVDDEVDDHLWMTNRRVAPQRARQTGRVLSRTKRSFTTRRSTRLRTSASDEPDSNPAQTQVAKKSKATMKSTGAKSNADSEAAPKNKPAQTDNATAEGTSNLGFGVDVVTGKMMSRVLDATMSETKRGRG